jgi:hypothetical protein
MLDIGIGTDDQRQDNDRRGREDLSPAAFEARAAVGAEIGRQIENGMAFGADHRLIGVGRLCVAIALPKLNIGKLLVVGHVIAMKTMPKAATWFHV